jgi:hypothetical protein
METELNCLTDCNGACCKGTIFLSNLTEKQKVAFDHYWIGTSTRITTVEISEGVFLDGVLINPVCPFLDGNKCRHHGTDLQPEVCKVVKPGSNYCLNSRKDAGFILAEEIEDKRRSIQIKI